MDDLEIPEGVGWTALLAAYGRAQGSRQDGAMCSDPLASLFVDAVGGRGSRGGLPRLGPAVDDGSSALWNAWRFYFSQRTPFYDERVLSAVGHGCRQVVLLAAGLDSRAFRLGLGPSVTVFELDQAPVLAFKDTVLSRHGARPECRRIPVAVDLRSDWPLALLDAGFDASRPTMWTAEGLLMYLSRADADQLLATITGLSAPGSRLAAEYFSRRWQDADVAAETLDEQDRAAWHMVRAAFRYGPLGDHPAAWLAAQQWAPGDITHLAELGQRQSREIPPEFGRTGAPKIWLFEGEYRAPKPLAC